MRTWVIKKGNRFLSDSWKVRATYCDEVNEFGSLKEAALYPTKRGAKVALHVGEKIVPVEIKEVK